jgi:hypothetical protein
MQLLGRRRWEEYIKKSLNQVEGKGVGWFNWVTIMTSDGLF